MYYCQKDSLHCFSFDSLAPSKFLPSFLKHFCAHQFKSSLCAAPRAFEKNGQMLDPVGNWQMPLLFPSEVFSFIQHNCYSSVLLHKQVTPTKQSQSKGFYCFCKSFMIEILILHFTDHKMLYCVFTIHGNSKITNAETI